MPATLGTAALPLLCSLLLLGGLGKLATVEGEEDPGRLTRLGPAVLVPERWRKPVMVACAYGELALAPALLLWGSPLPRWGTVLFFTIATYVLWDLRRRRPDVGCGCFGEMSATPVGLRSIARCAVLTALALALALTEPVSASGLELLAGWTGATWAWAAAGLVLLLLLSPEVEELAARLHRHVPCEQRQVPAERTLAHLMSSTAWQAHRPLLVAEEPSDSWRELCWRFFVYPGRNADGEPVDVVFAVHLEGRRPPVRSAVVPADGAAPASVAESIPV